MALRHSLSLKVFFAAALVLGIVSCTLSEGETGESAEYTSSVQPATSPYVREFDGDGTVERVFGPYKWTMRSGEEVPMRDGTILKTDLFIPDGIQSGALILIRTPYGSVNFWPENSGAKTVQTFVSHGYIVAVQNTRGKYGSGGEFTPSVKDDIDTYDTMEWASEQDWFNGRIGTFGCSYLGESQVVAARNPHPAWKAAIPRASGGANNAGPGRDTPFALWTGGAYELANGVAWFVDFGGTENRPKGELDYHEMMRTRPPVDALKNAGLLGTDYEDFITEPPSSPYWDKFPYLRVGETLKVPSLFVEGLNDYGPQDVVMQFEAARAADSVPPDYHRLVLSPMRHCAEYDATANTVIGTREIGDARFDYFQMYLDWFDYFLRDDPKGIGHIPLVQVYSLGANKWEVFDDWPPASAEKTSFYLTSDYGLSHEAPEVQTGLSYVYDPDDPVPTHGSPVCCVPARDGQSAEGYYDQAELDDRTDILRFQTQRLDEKSKMSGPVEVVLFVSSDAVDTDFTAKLIDVYPDGTAFTVTEGIQRVRWRNHGKAPEFMKAGEVYDLRIDLEATNSVFKAGHRIRVDISSSNFPRFDVNMNVETPPALATTGVKATNTVHIGGKHASRLEVYLDRGD